MSENADNARIRRLESLARSVADLDLDDPDLIDALGVLKVRAEYALGHRASKTPEEWAKITVLARQRAAERLRGQGTKNSERFMPFIRDAIKNGADSYSAIARELDKIGVKPVRAAKWSDVAVKKMMERAGETL